MNVITGFRIPHTIHLVSSRHLADGTVHEIHERISGLDGCRLPKCYFSSQSIALRTKYSDFVICALHSSLCAWSSAATDGQKSYSHSRWLCMFKQCSKLSASVAVLVFRCVCLMNRENVRRTERTQTKQTTGISMVNKFQSTQQIRSNERNFVWTTVNQHSNVFNGRH